MNHLNKDPDMKKKNQYLLVYIIISFILFYVLQSFLVTSTPATIPYSEFKKLLSEGVIEEVTISSPAIRGTFKRSVEERGKDLGPKSFVTIKVDDPDLVMELEKYGVKYSGQYESRWIRDLFSWLLPIGFLFLIWGALSKKMGPGMDIMGFGRSRAKLYSREKEKATFEDVAGVDEAKEELVEIVEFLREPEKFQRLGGKIPKGVLLVGPPGTGKTLLARAVAGEAAVPFFSMSGSEFVEMFVGVGASRVRDLFAQAQAKAPCIVFIDELDALGKARGVSVTGGHDEREQTLNQLLVEMDGFDTRKGVIIMAATNKPEILDSALMRPGRFDRQVLVDRPDLNGREAILRVHAKNVTLSPQVDLKLIAARTPGMVGADLANVVNEAALLASRRGKKWIENSDFEEAIDRVMAGLQKKNRIMSKKEKEIVAYHEAGHAIVAESVPTADPVHKISIIPRGIAALGYTLQLPTEDRYLMTKTELLDKLAVLMGGRIAEDLIFGEISTGAQNDLKRATDIARSMVKEYGMSEKLGPITFEDGERPLYLSLPMVRGGDYSQETAKEIDAEVKRIITTAYDHTRQLLQTKRNVLERVARVLLEKELIEGDELRSLLKVDKPLEPLPAPTGGKEEKVFR